MVLSLPGWFQSEVLNWGLDLTSFPGTHPSSLALSRFFLLSCRLPPYLRCHRGHGPVPPSLSKCSPFASSPVVPTYSWALTAWTPPSPLAGGSLSCRVGYRLPRLLNPGCLVTVTLFLRIRDGFDTRPAPPPDFPSPWLLRHVLSGSSPGSLPCLRPGLPLSAPAGVGISAALFPSVSMPFPAPDCGCHSALGAPRWACLHPMLSLPPGQRALWAYPASVSTVNLWFSGRVLSCWECLPSRVSHMWQIAADFLKTVTYFGCTGGFAAAHRLSLAAMPRILVAAASLVAEFRF